MVGYFQRARLRCAIDGPIADVARIFGRERLLPRRVDARGGDERHDRRGQILLERGEGDTTSGNVQHELPVAGCRCPAPSGDRKLATASFNPTREALPAPARSPAPR